MEQFAYSPFSKIENISPNKLIQNNDKNKKFHMRGEDFMIRKIQASADIERVAEIWLQTNIKAHNFVSAEYWIDNFEKVKEMLLQAEVYVFEDESEIQGFVGLSGDYIAGIFVWNEAQSRGIGKKLLDFIKGKKENLSLSVYQKNVRAIKFYEKENFKIQSESIDESTGEKEYLMSYSADLG